MFPVISVDQIQKLLISNESIFKRNLEQSSKLEIPVNLNVFDSYYKTFNQFRYLDEYAFDDEILVLNAKNISNYKESKNWLKNLRRTNNRTFTRGVYTNLGKDLDWISNNFDLKLSNILNLDVSNKSIFTPLDKKIYLNYDYLHSAFIKEFAYYFTADSDLKNKYSEILFGKLKDSFSDVNALHPYLTKEQKICDNLREFSASSKLSFHRFFEDGFEGSCAQLSIFGRHYAFPDANTKRWITPYAAYRFNQKNYYQKEYHYYSLGDFAEFKGRSSNLVQNSQKTLWFIDYDDIFKLKINNGELRLELDLSKIPKDISNFVKISSKLKFHVKYKLNGEEKIYSFIFRDVIEDKAKIVLEQVNNVFDSINLLVSSDDSILLNEDYVYKLNISDLLAKGNIYKDIVFDSRNSNKYMPSQLLDDEILSDFFYFVSNHGHKIPASQKILKELKVSVNYNDEKGYAIIYYEFMGEQCEVYVDGFKRLPYSLQTYIEAATLEDAKKQLIKKYPSLNDYFWKNVAFIPESSSDYFEDRLNYVVSPIHENELVRKQWVLDGIRISVINTKSIAPEFVYDPNHSKLSDLFKLNDNSRNLNLNKTDYKFSIVDREGDRFKLLVSANDSEKYYGSRIYDVLIPSDRFKKHDSSDVFFSDIFEQIIWIFSGTVLVGSALLTFLLKFKPVKNKFFKI